MNPSQLRSCFGFSAKVSAEKVTGKKLDFIRDHGLVGRPVVDVEMIDTRVDAELTFRGLARGVYCRARFGNLVVRSHADQPRTVKRGGVPDRIVGRAQQP